MAAEMEPYAKAGGLADVIGSLPKALAGLGNHVSVLLPGYQRALAALRTEAIGEPMSVVAGAREQAFSLRTGIGKSGVPIYFIVHDGFFGRDGFYGEDGRDYPDNRERFIFFCRAAATVLARHLPQDVVHSHDWHAALLPILMRADARLRGIFDRTASVFTIHNLAFQGLLPGNSFPLLGLDRAYFSIEFLEFYGQVNLMKGAVVMADAATTVSPTYARETAGDPAAGFGLEGVLGAKGEGFLGILNGADYSAWNPATDCQIPHRFGPGDISGKAECARALRRELKLAQDSPRAMVAMVSRLSSQKGFDLLCEAIDSVMALPLEMVILGSGDREIEQRLLAAAGRYRDRLRVITAFDDHMAHRIQAGCDMFLMPSRFEPCGLTQMYAMKYGTVPIVRATGGLADTVSEFDPASGAGTGFIFHAYSTEAMVGALARALLRFAESTQWKRLIANCMAADFSWQVAAEHYGKLFAKVVAGRRGGR